MIRERRLASPAFTAGGQVSSELPKDAVYHQIQIELDGKLSIAYGGAAATASIAEGFPFNLINKVRLIRNGSDTVWQGSGKQMAKEQLMLNGRFPFARIWRDAVPGNGTAQALLTNTINGVLVPSNSEGIGCNAAIFQDVNPGNNTTSLIDFRGVLELWLQLGVSDNYFTTLVDARPLASYILEITWANNADFFLGASGTLTTTVNCSVQSYDQDNLQLGVAFGTFKRASFQPPGLAFSSSQVQALLPRGNLYYGVIMETLGIKTTAQGGAGNLIGTPITQPGNDIIGEIQNRINSNYQLRDVFFKDLQAKNRNDGLIPSSPYDPYGGAPYGWAFLYYPSTGDSIKELVATYTMDQFDLLLNVLALTGVGDGNVYTGTPTVNLLTQEVIPGKSVASNAARGSFAGSMSATSAKPGV